MQLVYKYSHLPFQLQNQLHLYHFFLYIFYNPFFLILKILYFLIYDLNHYYNFFIQYIGVDEKEEYQNRLYQLQEDCKQRQKPFVLVEEIKNPSIEESNYLRLQHYENKKDILQQLSEKIVLLGNDMLQNLLQRAFFATIEEYQNALIYNTALKLVCWLNRYSHRLLEYFDYETLPLFLYYGEEINESQILFLNLLSHLPVDILYVSPAKTSFESSYSKIVELPEKNTWFPFPQKAIKLTRQLHQNTENDKTLISPK